MLDNCRYNNAKIIHKLSCLCWFIQNHALDDAQKANDEKTLTLLKDLHKDLENHINAMDGCMCSCK